MLVQVLRSIRYRTNEFMLGEWPIYAAMACSLLRRLRPASFADRNQGAAVSAKVFCQVKDDADVVEDWINWHGYLFGYDNVYVIADRPSEATNTILRSYASQINLVYTPFIQNTEHTNWDGKKQENLSILVLGHVSEADFLIPLDIDEFVSFHEQPSKRKILRELARLRSLKHQSFKFYVEYLSCTLQSRLQRPAAEITDFRQDKVPYNMKKCFAKSHEFKSIGLGQHNIYTKSNSASPMVCRLCLIHLKWRGLDHMKNKCLQNCSPPISLSDGTVRVPRGGAHYLEGVKRLNAGTFGAWARAEIGEPNRHISKLTDFFAKESFKVSS